MGTIYHPNKLGMMAIIFLAFFFKIIATDACQSYQFNCTTIGKCVNQSEVCNNVDDCGDLSDERQNCPRPNALVFVKVQHHRYEYLAMVFIIKKEQAKFNYTTLVKLFKRDGLSKSEEVYPGRFTDIIQQVTVYGIDDNTVYNVSIQAKSITGALSDPVYKSVTISKRAPPNVPAIKTIEHKNYNSIEIKLEKYPDGGSIQYTTTFKTSDVDGKKAADDVIRGYSFVDGVIGNPKLQNGSTYYITIESSNFLGNTSKIINYTIPRMAAPGPVENVRVEVLSKVDKVSIMLRFNRPTDEGGTVDLRGELQKCFLVLPKNYSNCEFISLNMGSSKTYEKAFNNLPQNTNVFFEIIMKSKIKQIGQMKEFIFKTPATTKSSANKLHGGSIAGFIIVSIMFVCQSLSDYS